MNGYDCDTVRDLLPQLARGGLESRDAVRMQTHLSFCADCRDEADLVELIQSTLDPLPDGLETRVLAAVHESAAGPMIAPAPSAIRSPRVSARQWPVRLALAATIAAAAIGGLVVLERTGLWVGGNSAGIDAPAMSILSWVDADDAMLHGGTVLQELTVEELEQLLEELDS